MNIENIDIVKYPNDVLRKVSKEIEFSEEVLKVAEKMVQLTISNNGIGLAANQVGLDWRLFVMYIPKEMKKPMIFINPKIKYGCVEIEDTEGCLSEPNKYVNIKRNRFIILEYLNSSNKIVTERFKDLQARCIQHEIDHLDGKMISDYI